MRAAHTREREDRSRPPWLVPLVLLGGKMEAEELSAGGAYAGSTYSIGALVPTSGGPALQTLVLAETDFDADAMEGGGELSLEEMKLQQLKVELAARGSKRTGLKPSLQRRLHGLLVQAAIARRGAEEAAAGVAAAGATGAGAKKARHMSN